MINMTKLFLVALVLYVASLLCSGSDNLVLVVVSWLFRFAGMIVFLIWLLVIFGVISTVDSSNHRRCQSCASRHYIAYSRGSKFGFAFPARFVKATKTDFHCQNCGHRWSITEVDEREADP